jgi:hypothetical protein
VVGSAFYCRLALGGPQGVFPETDGCEHAFGPGSDNGDGRDAAHDNQGELDGLFKGRPQVVHF